MDRLVLPVHKVVQAHQVRLVQRVSKVLLVRPDPVGLLDKLVLQVIPAHLE